MAARIRGPRPARPTSDARSAIPRAPAPAKSQVAPMINGPSSWACDSCRAVDTGRRRDLRSAPGAVSFPDHPLSVRQQRAVSGHLHMRDRTGGVAPKLPFAALETSALVTHCVVRRCVARDLRRVRRKCIRLDLRRRAELRAPQRAFHAFSSRLSSLKKRQSVPSGIIRAGLDLIRPASRSRKA